MKFLLLVLIVSVYALLAGSFPLTYFKQSCLRLKAISRGNYETKITWLEQVTDNVVRAFTNALVSI